MPDYPTRNISSQEVLERSFDGTIDSLKFSQSTLGYGDDTANNLTAVQNKPVASATYSANAFSARLNDVDIAVKTSAGVIKSITASNINAAIRYLQIHNKASAPANPDVPIFSFPIAAGSSTAPSIREIGTEFFGEGGYYLSTGISIGISTTADTFTAATTTDHVVNGTYV